MRRIVPVVLLCGIALGRAGADVPVRVEQLIYSIAAFNGGDYSSTFALQTADALYLVAGTDNLLSVRKTLVYWWPITAEWKTDTDTLNQPFTGSLEIRGPGATIRTVPLRRLTYFSTETPDGEQWKILYDADADREVARAQKQSEDYFAAVTDFQAKSTQYDAKVESLGARISELKAEGKDASAVTAGLQALQKPVAPATTSMYGTAPEPAQDWFVVNLAPGEYMVRLLGADGSAVEGSDKGIIAFSWRRTGGIGYEVIPSDKWTRPEESKTPASVLYVNGSTDLYVQPFSENEANDLEYEKMVVNQASGNPSMYKWVRKADVTGATLKAARAGQAPIALTEQAFIVKQAAGSSLGYTITPYDPATAAADEAPSLVAFPVTVQKSGTLIRFALENDGHAVSGSERQVRVVKPLPGFAWFAFFALAPLLAMTLVLALRARRMRGAGSPSNSRQ
jgi:hypothetical protein